MSVNITVNGKFTKQTILDDPERAKKELENKRRTLRLQQVRAQSKELARKIRNDVSEEKEKQLRNLEAVKAQELNCWREHVLAQKCHDYQKSINEIGRAHKAAKAENYAKKLPKNEKVPYISKYKAATTRVSERKSDTKLKCDKIEEDIAEKQIPDATNGRRIQVCFDDNLQHCSCINVSDSEGDEKYDMDFASSSLSSASSLEAFEKTETRCTQTETPAASSITTKIDVAVQNASPVVYTEKALETTRKLDKNTQLSPKKSTACTQTSNVTSTTETSKTDVLSTSSLEVIENRAPPRYTQISDLIAKQTQTNIDLQNSPPSPKENIVIVEKSTTSETLTKKSSPIKSPKSITSRLMLAPKSSAATILTPGTTERMASGSDSSSRVQYYDYRNKYSRQYICPSAKAVPQTDQDEPNAMQRACLEKSLQKTREDELKKLKQKSDERGQRALEREQVRRECLELTEKLEALTQNQQSLLPTDANLHNHQYYAVKTARKESKLNGAIEELLSRPAIITCPDVRSEKFNSMPNVEKKTKFSIQTDAGDLNLGATHERPCGFESATNNSNLSSDSSASILLGYIDDQRNNIRKEITQCETNPSASQEKVDKLQKLFERIEHLRGSLLKEINKDDVVENCAAETEKDKQKTKVQKKSICKPPKSNKEIEMLEKKCFNEQIAEKIETIKDQKKGPLAPTASMAEIKIVASDNQIIECPQPGKPLEIIIKVQSEKIVKKSPNLKVGKSTVTKQFRTEFKKSTKFFSNIPAENCNVTATGTAAVAPTTKRRHSYDSNSTAYHSIPEVLANATEQFVKRMSKIPQACQKTNQTNETTDSSVVQTVSNASTTQAVAERPQRLPRAHLNPLISQYIQRLLVMSRDSVNALEVSSSEIETPGSSIINITTNMPNGDSGESLLLSEDHVQRVERFINDNRSFINELEESFRTHSNSSLETSLRRLEEAWKQKFRNADKSQQPINDNNDLPARSTSTSLKPSKKQSINKERKSSVLTVEPKQKVAPKRQKQREPQSVANRKEKSQYTQIKAADECIEQSQDNELLVKSQTQLKHYAELTKNCSSRIAELTELITKVRAEKQRLLEITLTSVSDNERNSTEYRDLPATSKGNNEQQQQIDTAATASGSSSIGSCTAEVNKNAQQGDHEIETSAVLPLEKHKKTGQSRDSGISMPSRPVTAMGNENETEPQSFASSSVVQTSTTTHITSSAPYKKTRPPPALTTQNRYSPQAAEDEVVHELSTIVEVDTPATSRLNTSLQVQSNQQITQQSSKEALRFPTFEEYVRTNNLDLTTLDQEQSLHMELEYNELIEALQNGQGDEVVNYDAFPTLSAYLQNLTTNEEKCYSPETLDDLFECLRLTPIAAKPFPSHRQYLEQRKPNSTDGGLVDSDSLENATTGGASAYTETESETIDIEGELQRRNILKGSFRSLSTRREMISSLSSSGGKKREHSKIVAHSTAIDMSGNGSGNVTGTERPNSSVSDSASEKFQQELKALGLQLPQTMRKREKQVAALSNSSSSEATTHMPNDKLKKSPKKPNRLAAELLSDSESSDRPLNLRDFLTRQLLKHAAVTSSADSSLSGDSLRSQFFLAVLDSMTPSGSPRATTNTNTTHRNERQKTSTPVPSPTDGASVSNSTQLFSNESHISAVHPNRSHSSTRNSRSDNKTTAKDKCKRRDT